MNLYIIILKGVLCFFLPTVEKLRTQVSHTQQKKKISFQKRDQNRISVSSLQKAKKKEGDVNFHPFSLSLCNSALDALFKDEFHARKRHIFVAVVVL